MKRGPGVVDHTCHTYLLKWQRVCYIFLTPLYHKLAKYEVEYIYVTSTVQHANADSFQERNLFIKK